MKWGQTGWLWAVLWWVWAGPLLEAAPLPGEGTVRSRALTVPTEGRTGFTRLDAAKTGLNFTNAVPESRHLTNQLLLDGGGVTAGDVDGDGRPDLFMTTLGGGSRLWRNVGGLRFEDGTIAAFGTNSALAKLDATGCVFADLDANGLPDLVVSSHGQGTHVFLNDGAGRFRPLTVLNPGRGGHSIAVADVDGDGWLDLYLVNYRARALMDMPNARATFKVVNGLTVVDTVDGRPTTAPDLTNRFTVTPRGGVEELGEPDVLYRGLGGTNFVEVSWTTGAFVDAEGKPLEKPPFEWGLSAMFRDLNGDGLPELYVCNDFQSPDRLWWNESRPGQVRFRERPTGALRHTSRFSMGVDFADVNRDGHDDFVVLDMLSRVHEQRLTQLEDAPPTAAEQGDPRATPQYDVNTLQMGQGDGTFVELAAFAGVQASEWSWTPAFLDVDLDGWEDLLVTTGQWRAARDLDVAASLRRQRQTRRMTDAELFAARREYPRLEPPQVAFRNEGGRFRECAAAWGFDFAGVAQGMCLADLDGDGDLEAVVNHLNATPSVFRNETIAPRVAIRLVGAGGNRSGVGARIQLRSSGEAREKMMSQEMTAGGRYLSGDAPERTFAMPGAGPWSLEVRWPGGRMSRVADVATNRVYEIHESGAVEVPRVAVEGGVKGLFEDRSAALPSDEPGEVFDEFIRQPLLPRRLNGEGSGVAFADVDGDGREELVFGGVAGGRMTVLRANGDFTFAVWTNVPTARRQPSLLPWNGGLLISESAYTDGARPALALSVWPGPGPTLGSGMNSAGALAMGDTDGDGIAEVFVGARCVPGHWPRMPSSAWVIPGPGGFEVRQVLTNAGLVTGAVFSDLDGDGNAELALASEWGEPRFHRNVGGKLVPWTRPFVFGGTNLAEGALSGWWTSVSAGDFDGDGRMDLVFGNWGRNSYYELFGLPLAAYHGDWDGDGSEDVFMAYGKSGSAVDAGLEGWLPVHGLGVLGTAVPALRERFKSHRAFARTDLAEILGTPGRAMRRVTARWLESVVLLNRAEHWEVRLLPEEIQWSVAWGIGVGDWDGDGREDLFVAQNCFGQNHGFTRDDAGLGRVALGDGTGGFRVLSPAHAGVRIEGEGRAVAVGDPDGDGREDVLVTMNDAGPRIFRNVSGRTGLRVQLLGPPGNPGAAGAQVRWVSGGKSGPVRGWHVGSGHGGSDSGIRVLAREGEGSVEVRWPGGKRETVPVKRTTRTVRVKWAGGVEEEP